VEIVAKDAELRRVAAAARSGIAIRIIAEAAARLFTFAFTVDKIYR
jgi:hypothetical protein